MRTKTVKFNDEITVLTAPLGKEWKQHLDVDGRLDVVIEINLGDLIDYDIESINELADEAVLGQGADACLLDISYQVVGGTSDKAYIGGTVFVRVSAIPESND